MEVILNEEFKQQFPSRNTFVFDKGIRVSSDFDQGNLLECVKLNNGKLDCIDEIHSFEMKIAPDSWPYVPESNMGRAGFFFSITGLSDPKMVFDQSLQCDVQVQRIVKIYMKNMSNQAKLLSYGHMPVFYECSKTDHDLLISGKLPFYR